MRKAATSGTPGWRKPMVVLLSLMILLFIVVAWTVHGFRWERLLTS
jgi:hypothetical protein